MVERVLQDGATPPQTITLLAVFRQPAGQPQWELLPTLQRWGRSLAPAGEGALLRGDHVEIAVTIPCAAFASGSAACRLLEEVYAHFGFDAERVPFTTGTGAERRIDPEQLINIRS